MLLLCSDGVVLTVTESMFSACATLRNLVGDCGDTSTPVPVPFDSAALKMVRRFCYDIPDDDAQRVEALRVADFLGCTRLVTEMNKRLATRMVEDGDVLTKYNLPEHLVYEISSLRDSWREVPTLKENIPDLPLPREQLQRILNQHYLENLPTHGHLRSRYPERTGLYVKLNLEHSCVWVPLVFGKGNRASDMALEKLRATLSKTCEVEFRAKIDKDME